MLTRRLKTILLVTFLLLITTPVVLGAEMTVSPTSDTNAQDVINNAIDSVASDATANNKGYVFLTAGTYNITAPIILKSNVVLKGAGDDTVIFGSSDSVCNSKDEPAYITASDVSNIEICNLQFRSTASKFSDGGVGEYRDCIMLIDVNKCTVHDILFTRYLYNDGVQILRSSNVTVYNCRFYSAAHDGVSIVSDSENCRVSNCDLQVQTNTGVRVDSGIDCEVDHNTFTSGTVGSGWCCIQLQSTLTNVNVHHNIIHDFRGSDNSAGIGSVRARGSINIHDNVMWNVSPYTQVSSQTNNTLGPDDKNVSNWVAKGYGYGSIDVASIILASCFTSSSTSGNAPFNVKFTDKSTGMPTLWFWDFGDGTNSTEQNPAHTYSTEGTYTVTLTVSNGHETDSRSALITVLKDSGSSGRNKGSDRSSGGSGGSSGGAGGSPEPQSNVEFKELSQGYVSSSQTANFTFPKNVTPVVYIKFDSKKSFGKTTTIAEMLKGKSNLVPELPKGETYKSINVWVGSGGVGTAKNIENAVICFRADKAWIKDNKIEKDSIILNRYATANKKWEQLPTTLLSEDKDYTYFTAKTPEYGSFAITGTVKKNSEETEKKLQPLKTETINNTSTKESHAGEKEFLSLPCFEISYGIVSLLAVFLYKRKSW